MGGVAILNSKYLESLAGKEGHDLLILPCTEQDFVVTPWVEDMDINAIKEFVKGALQTGPEAILTRNIFCYRKDTGRLEVFS